MMMFQRESSVGLVAVVLYYYTLFSSVGSHVLAFCPSAPPLSLATSSGTISHAVSQHHSMSQTVTSLFATGASLPSPEESAKALQEYMAKSHEQKIKAIQDAEAKKQVEIDALKAQVEELKAGATGALSTTTSTVSPTDEVKELQQKLIAYQNFMAKYIVDAQEAKARAVAEAQASTAAVYEKKLLAAGVAVSSSLPIESPTASLPSSSSSSSSSTNNKLYQDRNAMVSKAAVAGKSRWGEAEVQRLTSGKASAPVPTNAAPAIPVPSDYAVMPVSLVASTAEVVNADHGLRNDGGVGGPTLAERIASGAAIATSMLETTTAIGSSNNLYLARNKAVADAGNASRWGPMEVERAATTITTMPIDGDAATVNGATTAAATTSSSNNQVLYYARNQVIAKSGMKSRWGPMEVERATALAALPPPTPATPIEVSPEIAAADHGLRADGGVSGPTLAERVNLGAKILASMK